MNESKKHTNYSLLGHNQLVDTIKHYVQLNNLARLHELNNRRTILALRNKITLYKRFVLLISMNDIARLHTLVKVCLNRNCGINGIIEKIKAASDAVYRPKQWTKDDRDLGSLVMNIGGPALVKSFNHLNLLPSASYMYKVCF